MSHATPPSDRPEVSSDERNQVISEVLEDQARREAAREAARQAQLDRPERSFYLQVGALVLGTFFFYLLFFSPRWVTPTAAEPIAEQEVQDGLRFSVFLTAQRVEDFRLRNGRLPADASELGILEPNLTYQRVDAETYELRGTHADNEVVYQSSEPIDELAATAAVLLDGRS